MQGMELPFEMEVHVKITRQTHSARWAGHDSLLVYGPKGNPVWYSTRYDAVVLRVVNRRNFGSDACGSGAQPHIWIRFGASHGEEARQLEVSENRIGQTIGNIFIGS